MLHVARTQDKQIFFKDSIGENFKLVLICHVEFELARVSRSQIFQLKKTHWTVMSK
jgi:hypothetical protein